MYIYLPPAAALNAYCVHIYLYGDIDIIALTTPSKNRDMNVILTLLIFITMIMTILIITMVVW